jgi:hypothetical protein
MAYATLALIQPLDPATGNRVSIYVSSINDAATGRLVNGLNGNVWVPAITQAPTVSISVWNGDFQNSVSLGSASLPINMQAVKDVFPSADTYYWETAPVTIYAEQPGTAWPWTQRFKGLVTGYGRKAQVLTLTAQVDTKALEANVLTQAYAGTGGIEGDSSLKNKLKPLIFGWASNVEPILIDTVNNVYQFCAYGAIEGVTTLYERGSDFGASVGDFANYTALVAATIPPGKWGTCLASGLIRLGAPAYGVITGDVKGYKVSTATPRRTGAIINAAATIAGVSSTFINTSSLTALDTAVAYNVNIVLTEQTTLLELAQRMALPCLWQCGVNLDGTLFVSQITLSGSPVLSLDGAGKTFPQVVASDELDVTVPYYKTILGANRSWRVHSADEIAFSSKFVELGLYSGSTTYREGNVVSLPDGSRYLYINATATSGNSPPNATYWQFLSGAPLGTNLCINSELALIDPSLSAVYPVGFEQAWSGNSTNVGAGATYVDARITLADNTYALTRTWTGTPNGTAFDNLQMKTTSMARFAIPVVPGDTLSASALAAWKNCTGMFLNIEWLDENGVYVGETGGATLSSGNAGATAYTSLERGSLTKITYNGVVPADGGGAGGSTGNRRWAVFRVRFNISGAAANPSCVCAAMMVAKVPTGQTLIPEYVPGPADRQASYGAVTGSNLVSTTYGTLSDAQVKTDLGVSAAVVGQTAWATYSSLTPAQVAQISPNMIPNPTGVLGMQGWTVASGAITTAKGQNGEGWFFWANSGGNGSPPSAYRDVPAAAGNTYTISAEIAAQGITVTSGATAVRVYVQWLTSAFAHNGYSTTASVNAGINWVHATSGPILAPAGTTYARIWMDASGTGVYTISSIGWAKLKLQSGSVDTIFTDDATYGAKYDDGTAMQSLQPAEASSTRGAPTGTPVGSLTNASDVSSTINSGGGVATDKVATAAIQANAVSTLGSAYTAGAITLTTATDITVQSIAVTYSGSGSVDLFAAAMFTLTSSSYVPTYFRIYRDTTLIADILVNWNSVIDYRSIAALDTPPSAGTYTYYFKINATFTGTGDSTYRYLRALAMKR